jgi:hypothetical protein
MEVHIPSDVFDRPAEVRCPCADMIISGFHTHDAAMRVWFGATVRLEECSFVRNRVHLKHDNTTAVVYVAGFDDDILYEYEPQDTILIMEEVLVRSNSAIHEIIADNVNSNVTSYFARVYSDVPVDLYELSPAKEKEVQPQPLSQIPPGREGINSSHPWLLRVQQVCTPNCAS